MKKLALAVLVVMTMIVSSAVSAYAGCGGSSCSTEKKMACAAEAKSCCAGKSSGCDHKHHNKNAKVNFVPGNRA